jgi:hypothetical protein
LSSAADMLQKTEHDNKKKTIKSQTAISAVILYSPFLPDVTSSYEAGESGKHKKQTRLTGKPIFTF